jgi:hypothetical protein
LWGVVLALPMHQISANPLILLFSLRHFSAEKGE